MALVAGVIGGVSLVLMGLVGDRAGEDGGDGVGASGNVKIGGEGSEIEAEAGSHSGIVFKNQDAHQTVLAG